MAYVYLRTVQIVLWKQNELVTFLMEILLYSLLSYFLSGNISRPSGIREKINVHNNYLQIFIK